MVLHMEHPPATLSSLSEVVKQRLEDAGISQRQAASQTGIPLTTLSRRLTGNSSFSVTELAALAGLFGIPVSRLAIEAEATDRSGAL